MSLIVKHLAEVKVYRYSASGVLCYLQDVTCHCERKMLCHYMPNYQVLLRYEHFNTNIVYSSV